MKLTAMKEFVTMLILALWFLPWGLFAQEVTENCFECSGNTSRGNKSSTFGLNNYVDGTYSSAFGYANNVSGESSLTMGNGNKASGICSFVMGKNSTTLNNYSQIFGSWSSSNALHSYIVGSFSNATGDESFVVGNNSSTGSDFAMALGHYLNSSTYSSFTVGMGTTESLLQNTISYSLVVGFRSNLPTLFVGPSAGESTTGKIGIGNVTNPLAKLHIKADITENATLRLESTGPGKTAGIEFGSSTKSITTKTGQGITFNANEEDFFFKGGEVGMGIEEPNAPLHVFTNTVSSPGPTKIRIERYEGGTDSDSFIWDLNNSSGFLKFQCGSGEMGSNPPMDDIMILSNAGSVGIGKIPDFTLDIEGSINFTSELLHNGESFEPSKWIENNDNLYYSEGSVGINCETPNATLEVGGTFKVSDQAVFNALAIFNGNIGIGTTNPGDYKLAVNGKILAEELKIQLNVPSSDFVFDDDYNLRSLSEVERFVTKHKHLPEVPSAEEFRANGYSVGAMDDLLLRKIEELTLYIIRQQKILEKQQQEIDLLKSNLAE